MSKYVDKLTEQIRNILEFVYDENQKATDMELNMKDSGIGLPRYELKINGFIVREKKDAN